MWFINRETGMQWDVTDAELIKRLENNEHYAKVEVATVEVKELPKIIATKNAKGPEKEQAK